jgi:leucyl aminopeptidase
MAKSKSKTRATRASGGVLIDCANKVRSLPVWRVGAATAETDLKKLTAAERGWLETTGFKPKAGAIALLPAKGGLGGAVLGLGEGDDDVFAPLLPGVLPGSLPPGAYHFGNAPRAGDQRDLAALSWALGSYRFDSFKSAAPAKPVRLKLPKGVRKGAIEQIADGVYLGRDLINRPANDLGPAELALAALGLAKRHGAKTSVVVGEALLKKNYPLVHAVGRASDRAPRLIEFVWGRPRDPKLTLVGKGICFDTGGLNLKPGSSMALMKKDMGGAAAVLALAHMIMSAKLKLRLKVIIPTADNNVSANAFRPGDILASRKGLSVEIGNTDAEGRLVLADGLARADEEAPDYLITMATLTGAARVALGPDLPPLYCNDERFARGVLASGEQVADPLWPMPFWQPYDELLASKVADVNHISSGPFAGSITAALFLKRFVARAKRYMHLDIYGWTPAAKPGRPQGGEAQGARALFDFFAKEFG